MSFTVIPVATTIAATADRPDELTGNFSLMRYLDIEMF